MRRCLASRCAHRARVCRDCARCSIAPASARHGLGPPIVPQAMMHAPRILGASFFVSVWSARSRRGRDACVLRHRPYSEGVSGATKVWRRPGLATFEVEDFGELDAGGDAEFGEDFVHVVFDGARADVELRGDLRVRFAVARERCDLRFLGGELAGRFDGSFACPFTGGEEFTVGAVRERGCADGRRWSPR
jgi:hypothetical protein